MGYYINPLNETKEEWLNNNGLVVTEPEWGLLATNFPTGVYVCLVDNGPFTAAAIAYNEEEFEAFLDPTDGRQKTWYAVRSCCLIDVCPDVASRLEASTDEHLEAE